MEDKEEIKVVSRKFGEKPETRIVHRDFRVNPTMEEIKQELINELKANKKKKNRYFKIELYSGEDIVYTTEVKSLSKKLAVVKLAFMSRKNKTLAFNLTRTTKAVIDGEIVWEKTLPEDTESE